MIAAVGDELLPFAIAHRPAGERVRREERIVTRALAIESEAIAAMPDRRHAGGALDPFHRGKLRNFTRDHILPHRRAKRILREEMLQIGEQQFLMLLLVVDAEFDERLRRRRQVGQRSLNRGVNVRTPDTDFVERRPGQQAALRPRMARTFGFVIAVEEKRVTLVVKTVAGHMIAQHEGFEEPRRMREVPFGGRRVGHRLRAGIGVGEGRDEIERQAPRRGETPGESIQRIGTILSVGAAGHGETIPPGYDSFRSDANYG
ncbi:MAG: hypothetical protein Q7T68_11750 [Sphingopyxis sp.]|nr:hypothetical protein [Sphingopyxis sp.]